MIDCCRRSRLLETLTKSEPLIEFKNPTVQLIYDVAVTTFRIGIYALFTYAAPIGSLVVSLACYGGCLYYKLVQERKIKMLLQSETSKEMAQKMLADLDSMSYLNRLQHEFELVNLVTLAAFRHLNVLLLLLCSGVSVWNWVEDIKADRALLKTISSVRQDIRSPMPDS